ncbi:MAG: hypothetical protein IJI41_06720 [Anaerolineaceae bacterium]|nr:hypothetical protein [Anaerolineaceae bacterium]
MNKENQTKIEEEKKFIQLPIVIICLVLVVIIGIFIFFGVKNTDIFKDIRDLTITLITFIMFIINLLFIILCFMLTSKIDVAKLEIRKLLEKADVEMDVIADKITKILRSILDPVIKAESKKAGLLSLFSKK